MEKGVKGWPRNSFSWLLCVGMTRLFDVHYKKYLPLNTRLRCHHIPTASLNMVLTACSLRSFSLSSFCKEQ